MMSSSKQLVVISGPTGSGESTITHALLSRFPNTTRLITATTRPPRSGEVAGVDYYFLSEEEFKQKQESGDILEATYHPNRNVYYGTYKPDLDKRLAANKVVLVNTDIVGSRYYKEHYNAVTIFISTQTVDELIQRIRGRNPEMSEEELTSRRENAEKEIREEQPFYDFVVYNEDGKLEEAITEVVGILKKEGYTLD